jgi:5-methyltetrahydrofolate--homocysteine methyltransferase
LLKLDDARLRRTNLAWSPVEQPAIPSFLGVRILDDFPLTSLVPFIDWSPFFHTWELKGIYPRIFEDPVIGAKAKELFQDAWKL